MTENKVYMTLFQSVKRGEITPEEFATFIKSVAGEGVIAAGKHICVIPTPLKDELHHIAETFKAIGDGEMGKGVERVKKNHDFTATLRKTRNKAGNAVMLLLIGAAFSGVIYVFKDFFKGLLR